MIRNDLKSLLHSKAKIQAGLVISDRYVLLFWTENTKFEDKKKHSLEIWSYLPILYDWITKFVDKNPQILRSTCNYFYFFVLGAIQIIRKIFLVYFRPHLPRVLWSFGDSYLYHNKAWQNTKIWFKVSEKKMSCDTLANPLSPICVIW